jgi:hypothetical protein
MVSQTSGTAVVISNSIDITDRAARLLGTLASFAISGATTTLAGNVNISLGAGVFARLKSCIITTAAGGGTRTLQVNGGQPTSKSAIASTTTADLLDRELLVTGTAGSDIAISAGAAGDTWVATRERVV